MFFLTNVDTTRDLARVFDTSDDTNDPIRFTHLMNYVVSGQMQVVGMGTNIQHRDRHQIGNTPMFYSIGYAREQLARWFVQNRGLTVEQAKRKVGLK